MRLVSKTAHTDPDCTLQGAPIALSDWNKLTSDDLARIVGVQSPGGGAEYAEAYDWQFLFLPTPALRFATEDGDEPEGGWNAAFARHCEQDAQAVADGSAEYAGRSEWLQHKWGKDTRLYPLFVVKEADGYRLWDGYRRLAGAFHFGLGQVAVLLGTRKERARAPKRRVA